MKKTSKKIQKKIQKKINKNGEYWEKRLKVLDDIRDSQSEKYIKDVEKQFEMAEYEISKDISKWYQRLADNNGISLSNATKLLKKNELQEFQWDIEEYIKKGIENSVDQRWLKQLENASAKAHISRLEAMKIGIRQHVEVLFSFYHNGTTDLFDNVLQDQYYRIGFEAAKVTGIATNFARLDKKKINTILTKPWAMDGESFSDRIWKNKNKLTSNLHTELSQNMIRGLAPRQSIDRLSKKMGVGKSQVSRLIMTESAAISSIAHQESFLELGVEEFEIVVTFDTCTSDICKALSGKIFKMSEYQVGLTVPPFHPWCRSIAIPYFNDEFTMKNTRAAREENGKTYYVDKDMTYEEWQTAFVNRENQEKYIEVPEIFDQNFKNAHKDFNEILEKSEFTTHNNKMLLYSQSTDYILSNDLEIPFVYNDNLDIIQYNLKAPDYDLYDINFVQAHELSHRMDVLEYQSWNDENFMKAIEKSQNILHNREKEIIEYFSVDGKYGDSLGISDIVSALSKGTLNNFLMVGHHEDYWEDEKNIYLEIFANISAVDVLNDSAKNAFIELFPELYEAYRRIVK